jgi:uncharacterized protein
MAKRVFIVHGWGANPKSDWYPWLAKMLFDRGIEVFVPKMPNTEEPHISTWVPYLAKVVGKADENTYFVGHSIGCQAIMRYVESLKGDTKVGGAFFVAGWFSLRESSLETDVDKAIAKDWTSSPIDLKKVKSKIPVSVACFSDNDPYVKVAQSKIFEEALGSSIIVHPNRGHFTYEDGVTELHVALNEILKMTKN